MPFIEFPNFDLEQILEIRIAVPIIELVVFSDVYSYQNLYVERCSSN